MNFAAMPLFGWKNMQFACLFLALHFEHSALQKYHEESVNKNSYNKIVKNIKMFETYLC